MDDDTLLVGMAYMVSAKLLASHPAAVPSENARIKAGLPHLSPLWPDIQPQGWHDRQLQSDSGPLLGPLFLAANS